MKTKYWYELALIISIGFWVSMTGCTSNEDKEAAIKANADIARIRELKEIEEARIKAENKSTEEFAAGMRKGAAAPIREFKTKP
jgi:hypothetical protein